MGVPPARQEALLNVNSLTILIVSIALITGQLERTEMSLSTCTTIYKQNDTLYVDYLSLY